MQQEQKQRMMMHLSALQQQSNEIKVHLDFIIAQITELEIFSKDLSLLKEEEKEETLSYIGRGVYLPSKITDKKLFVEVGSGVIVRKTIEETLSIIENQTKSLKESKLHLTGELDKYAEMIYSAIEKVKKSEK